MSATQEFDAREVERLKTTLEAECLNHVCYGKPLLDSNKTARFILAREARLVEALNDTIGIASDHMERGLLVPSLKMRLQRHRDDVLAAHRAATAPSEPTLEEAVDDMLEDRRFGNEESFVGVRVEHFNAVKAALARSKAARP